jgi:hypothetical protein
MHVWLLALCVTGCETTREPVDPIDPGDPEQTDPDPDDPTVTDSASPPVEACNGLDDDLDGEVDEGFPDSDGDGLADCVDDPVTVTPILATVEGEIPSPVANLSPTGAPAIGWFLDDDGNGVLGPGDLPVMVLDHNASETQAPGLRVVRADGSRAFDTDDLIVVGPSTILDVDGDGWTEVVSVVRSNYDEMRARAWRNDGTILWTSPLLPPYNNVWQELLDPSAGDLDGDGTLELVFKRWVVSGVDGSLRFQLNPPGRDSWWLSLPAVADLEGDGRAEILLGDCVFGDGPAPLWCADLGGSGLAQTETFPAAVDIDDDPELEVLLANQGALRVYESDGTPVDVWTIGGAFASQPCVADFDGDGALEVGFASDTALAVLNLDGSVVWSMASADDQDRGACSGADLDGDGAAELLFTHTAGLVIHDGASGLSKYADGSVYPSLWGVPAVADFDGDGFAEIVVPSGADGGRAGKWVVYGGPAWIGVGPQWALNDFAESRLTETGGVLGGDGGARLAREVLLAP